MKINILLVIEFDGNETHRYFENIDDARNYANQFPRFFKFTVYEIEKIAEF